MPLKRPRGSDTYENPSDLEEEALRNLLHHRLRETQYLRERIEHYTSLLAVAEGKVKDVESKLNRLTGQSICDSKGLETPNVNKCNRVISISEDEEDDAVESHKITTHRVFNTRKSSLPEPGSESDSSIAEEKTAVKACEQDVSEIVEHEHQSKLIPVSKAKIHSDLIPKLGSLTSPCPIICHPPVYVPGKHTRKLRTIAFSPTNDDVFATSAIDGAVKIWQLESNGSGACVMNSTNCNNPTNTWPADITWHTLGNSIFCAYGAESGEDQVSMINLVRKKKDNRVVFLPDKPHKRGLIYSIAYMPWDNNCFATGGGDHGVVIWSESDCRLYQPTRLHEKEHSAAVMGVAGLPQKKVVLSAGTDKRVIGYNVDVGKVECRLHLDSRCFSVVPNPCDCNLLLVQTGEEGKQLRLYDYRVSNTEAVTMGFKQEGSKSVSALIGQSWSPNGLYLSSGSVDPVVHLFDIRYNSPSPWHSIKAHQRRIFRAPWHQSRKLLVSISSDTNIGLHAVV